MFYENGLEILKDLHEVIDKFKEWLSTTEEVVYCDLYGNSYLELCAYYEAVKVCCIHTHVIEQSIYLH